MRSDATCAGAGGAIQICAMSSLFDDFRQIIQSHGTVVPTWFMFLTVFVGAALAGASIVLGLRKPCGHASTGGLICALLGAFVGTYCYWFVGNGLTAGGMVLGESLWFASFPLCVLGLGLSCSPALSFRAEAHG
jgi:hypothetical protein